MTFQSMTGYGSAQVESGGWRLSIECRSVNHRSLEARFFVSDGKWRWLEPVAVDIVRRHVRRGRVDVRVEVVAAADGSGQGSEASLIDPERFGAVCRELGELAAKNGLPGVELRDVLVFRSRFERQDQESEKVGEGDEAVIAAVSAAVEQLVASRKIEGEGISADLLGHLDRIENGLSVIYAQSLMDEESFQLRMMQRLQEALERFEVGEVDEQRLLQELVIYADRSDISEELQRAGSHVKKLRGLIAAETSGEPRGKKIDFYLQELFREANTMGSKSGSSDLTDRVIDIKSSIEKMREQAANVE